MLSHGWPQCIVLVFKVTAGLVTLAAAIVAWKAAHLWLEASKIAIEDTTPAVEVSHDDAPGLGILEAIVAVNAVKAAYNASALLNAKAARWTAWAAILAGAAALLGAF